ncbi:MAG: glycosyltransferase [Terracidiphilus sp.]|nr:glycosyltransferase [Terracidiphilus sp.]
MEQCSLLLQHSGSRRPIHILHIISSLSPEDGGPPEAVRQLVKAYIRAGDNIEVVCLDKPDEKFLADIPCPVHALGQSFLGRYAFSPRLLSWLRANVHRYDGIVVNGIWTFPGVAARRASKRAGKPYGVFVHGALDPWFNRKYPLKHLKKLLYWPVQYHVLRDARAVFFTTDAERDLAKTSFRPNNWNSIVVPYGINDPEERTASASDEIEAFCSKMPKLRDRRFLLFLARVHEKKGCDLLIKAFARVATSVPEVDLVVAGPDRVGLQAKLQGQAKALGIASRVHWPGPIGGDVKWGALRACEAFVLPSHQENFGIAVVESLAVGRPVLISDCVNIWPQIAEDGAGLVEKDTLEGTELLLSRWFGLSATDRDAMGIRGRASFVKRYSMFRAARVINHCFVS